LHGAIAPADLLRQTFDLAAERVDEPGAIGARVLVAKP
jgi:hypothetical protein